MPEGTVILILFSLVLAAALAMAVYCLRLAAKYRRIEAERRCIYAGTLHHVVDIIYDSDDWFLRKVRLHANTYPFVIDVLISDVCTVHKCTA